MKIRIFGNYKLYLPYILVMESYCGYAFFSSGFWKFLFVVIQSRLYELFFRIYKIRKYILTFQSFFQDLEVPPSRPKNNIRSLSETKSEDISDKINKRFDRAEAIEDYDSRSGSNDTLVKRNSALTKPPAYNQIPSSSSAKTGGM